MKKKSLRLELALTPSSVDAAGRTISGTVKKKSLRLELALTPSSVDAAGRTISGTVLPFGERGIALVNGQAREVEFDAAGDHQPFRSRVPLVFGHDDERPIGVVPGSELERGTAAIAATFAIDRTTDGDEALVQAASGSRAGLSVLAIVDDYDENDDGSVTARASRIVHVGLVGHPAFESAEVSRVAATQAVVPNERSGSVDPKKLRKLLGLAEGATDEQVAEALKGRGVTLEQFEASHKDTPEETTAPVETEARAPIEKPVILTRDREVAVACSAGELVLAMMHAGRGDRAAQAIVEAALTTVVSTDVPGLMPPAQTTEILGGLNVNRVLATRAVASRPLPATGMTISKPSWTTLPQGGWRANVPGAGEDDAIATNKPAVVLDDVDILEWAYGVSLSYAVATRSSPDAIESIYRAAVQDYYKAVEIKLAALIEAAAVAGGVGDGVGASIAASFNATDEAPALLLVAPDIYGDLIDAVDNIPTYSDGQVSGAGLTGVIAGLEVVVSPYFTAGTEIVAPRSGVEFRESSPIRLTANTIGALQVELGVTSFAEFDVEAKAGGYSALTPAGGAPAGASEAKRTAKKAKK